MRAHEVPAVNATRPTSSTWRVRSDMSMKRRLREARRVFTAAAEACPEGKLGERLPSGRVRSVPRLNALVTWLVAARAATPTARPRALLANHSSAESPLGVNNTVAAYARLDALRRSSLQRTALRWEPNSGRSRRAQSATSRSQSSTWKTTAPASGTHTCGSRAAFAADARMRSQPGVSVAFSPQAAPPCGSVAQPPPAASASTRHIHSSNLRTPAMTTPR
jgi:hypothetical protein